jgi:hypothetical protein
MIICTRDENVLSRNRKGHRVRNLMFTFQRLGAALVSSSATYESSIQRKKRGRDWEGKSIKRVYIKREMA